jgi:hypothetical protein
MAGRLGLERALQARTGRSETRAPRVVDAATPIADPRDDVLRVRWYEPPEEPEA